LPRTFKSINSHVWTTQLLIHLKRSQFLYAIFVIIRNSTRWNRKRRNIHYRVDSYPTLQIHQGEHQANKTWKQKQQSPSCRPPVIPIYNRKKLEHIIKISKIQPCIWPCTFPPHWQCTTMLIFEVINSNLIKQG
jgi:hypothetical protein